MIQTIDPVNGNKLLLSVEWGTDPEWSHLLHTTYAALCPIGPILMFAEIDEPATIFDYIDEDGYVETRSYKEWCAPKDYYDWGGTVIAKAPNAASSAAFICGRAANHFDAGRMCGARCSSASPRSPWACRGNCASSSTARARCCGARPTATARRTSASW